MRGDAGGGREMVLHSVRGLVAALLMAGATGAVVADQSQVNPAALAVAQSYFDALRSGDTTALLEMFAGAERSRTRLQLSDPTYSQFLSDRYRNARFEVSGAGLNSGSSFVDIEVWISDAESFKERLILGPSSDPADTELHIVARKDLDQR
jgi:hypothetical protein